MYNIGQIGTHPMQKDPYTTPEKAKLTRKEYEEELRKLQIDFASCRHG
jgi:hypothetical protein